MAAPAHFLGFEMIDFIRGGYGRMSIRAGFRRRPVTNQRMRRQRCSLRARGERSGAGGKSKGEFQKMAAFHDISLLVDGE